MEVKISMSILVTGASGLLGSSMTQFLANGGYDIIRHANSTDADVNGDFTDYNATKSVIDHVCPDVVINLIGLTSVDACETDIQAAYLINVRTVENLVASLGNHPDSFLIHISTDHVYDSSGFSREDGIRLTNTYALTKYAGEMAAGAMPSAVLRTNFFGHSLSPKRQSFSDWALDSLNKGKEITGFSDVLVNPLSMKTLSAMVARVIEKREAGVFNLGSHGGISKAEFIIQIAKTYGLDVDAVKIGFISDVNFHAYRPKDMRMDCRLFEKVFDLKLPKINDEIRSLRGINDTNA